MQHANFNIETYVSNCDLFFLFFFQLGVRLLAINTTPLLPPPRWRFIGWSNVEYCSTVTHWCCSINECFEQFCKLLHVNSLNTLLQLQKACVSKCKPEVNWKWRSVVPCCCGVQRMSPKKNDPRLTRIQNENALLFSRPAVTVALFHPRFFFLSCLGGCFHLLCAEVCG